MKARVLTLCALLAFLACEDDPTVPPPGAGPTAVFTVTRSTATTIQVDASPSDPGAGNSTLWVRWDWEDDGEWDTEWSEDKTSMHEYATEGVRTVRLEVGDPWRRLDQATRNVAMVLISTPESVVDALAKAYDVQDRALFDALLANDPDRSAEFLFLLSAPTDLGETQWGYAEEARIHQRMFEPETTPPGDLPVPIELWLEDVGITLTQQEAFAERADLYTPNGGPLDPVVWRAMDARYTTYVFFNFAGTDYRVVGAALFIVIEDLTKGAGDPRKYLLYMWEDIEEGVPAALTEAAPAHGASAATSWGAVKSLFR